MKYWKKILWNEFGIKVKTVRLGLFGEVRYVLYHWHGSNAGCVKLFHDEKLYTENQIQDLVYKMREVRIDE